MPQTSPRFRSDDRALTDEILAEVAAAGWQVMLLADRGVHLVVGRAGAFAVVAESDWAKLLGAMPGATRVVLMWRPFAVEVEEADGVFLVRGDLLPTFLRAQEGLIDTYEA